MLDVHAPHEKMHGVGDFFLHLFTITVGLLIALGLESLAERVHHHHQRDEADASLRQEISDNKRELQEMTGAIPGEIRNLEQVMSLLRARMENKPVEVGSLKLGLTLGSFRNAGWQTAAATGVVGYMEYGRAKQFAAAYQQQEVFTRLSDRTFDQFLQVESYAAGVDPTKLPPETARLAMVEVQREVADLHALDQIGAALKQSYDEALRGEAK